MEKPSKQKAGEFEQKVSRLHRLLEPDGVVVTWNDKIVDPDNVKRTRQIDITIRKANRITHIECRIHRQKQDVKWIEELYGRKKSLQADKLIAVSSSGFTKGAVLKAKRFNIQLKKLADIDAVATNKWVGERIVAKLVFYEFIHLNISFIFDLPSKSIIDNIDIYEAAKLSGVINKTLDILNNQLDELVIVGVTIPYRIAVKAHNLRFYKCSVEYVEIDAIIKIREQVFAMPKIENYADIKVGSEREQAVVESIQGFEVIKSAAGISWGFNPANVEMPLNTLLCGRPMVGFGGIYPVKILASLESINGEYRTKVVLPVLKCYSKYMYKNPEYFVYSLPFDTTPIDYFH